MSALREQRPESGGDLDLVDIAVQLYGLRTASQKKRYRGAPPPLPSKEIVINVVERLVSTLYPRHFGLADLDSNEVDQFVVTTLGSALAALKRQIELELALAREWKGDSRIDTPLRADDIVKIFAAALLGVRGLLDTDVRAAFKGDPSARSIDEIIFLLSRLQRHRPPSARA